MRKQLLLLAATVLLGGAAPSDPLPRSAVFGVMGTPQDVAGGGRGVRVDQILPGLTAEKLGLKIGDVVVDVNGTPVADMSGFAATASKLKGGETVRMTVARGGKRQTLTAAAVGRPRESYQNGTARYGAVPFRGGQLRDVMVTPPGGAKGPVVFLVQGYTCDSFETTSAESPHRRLIDGLLARGISTYRIEKPQAGDSRGGPDCRKIDFDTEMAGFETGYRTLMDKYGIAPDRIFLLGHSMGGIEAPLLAARVASPRGVAVYGTVMRNWHDYIFDIYRIQAFTGAGADPAEAEASSEILRDLIRELHFGKKTPAQLAATSPDHDRLLRTQLGWDGGDQITDRHYSFWQGLASQRLVAAWRDTRSNVLSVYGEGDVAAINNMDHKAIADVVNHYRPGTARFVEVPRTGHGMTLDGTMAEVRAKARSGNRERAPFNPALIDLFGDWIEATMREPTVASRFTSRAG